ncbi:MAG: sensor histidine kinase [Chromatiaceae bacterium]|nr:MAG: sensor histidine kinase [Chromatiaceae bacterium]
MTTRSGSNNTGGKRAAVGLDLNHERLTELERRSLLAEQAREQAHSLRSPLSVIKLVAETLQLELGGDRSRAERLQRVLDAVSSLSTNLIQNVCANRFADGPNRPVNAARIAAEVVSAFGGRVAVGASMPLADPEQLAEDAPVVLADEQGLEAALIHLLRLIGIGHACHGGGVQRPLLRIEQDQHAQRLRLRLTSEGEPEVPLPTERADYRLMLKAVERVVRNSDGALVLGEARATLELPWAQA